MQSYISHRCGRVFYPLIFFLSFFTLSCFIDLLRKISEIIENMIFSLIFVLRKIWNFRQMQKITKIWYLRWAFLRKWCFSCSVEMTGVGQHGCLWTILVAFGWFWLALADCKWLWLNTCCIITTVLLLL